MFQLKQLVAHNSRARVLFSANAHFSQQSRSHASRHYSLPSRPKTTFNHTTGKGSSTSARAPRSTTTQNAITFLAASALGAGAYFYQWNKHREGSVLNPFSAAEELTTEKWTPILLKSVTRVSNETSLFEFQLPKPCNIPISSAIYVKDDEIQAMRAYTPVHSTEKDQETVQLLIKRYNEGQVSRFMHSARPGQKIEMRGPVLIWPGGKSDLAKWDEIGMVAGGTGITAFLPIIHSALTHPTKKIKISLVFASHTPQELYFKDELDQLAKSFPGQFKVLYTVDSTGSPGPVASKDAAWNGNIGYVNETMLREVLPTPKAITAETAPLDKDTGTESREPKKSVVLVCGPEPMIKHLTGSRGSSGQDPIRGTLGAMGYQKSQVFRFPN